MPTYKLENEKLRWSGKLLALYLNVNNYPHDNKHKRSAMSEWMNASINYPTNHTIHLNLFCLLLLEQCGALHWRLAIAPAPLAVTWLPDSCLVPPPAPAALTSQGRSGSLPGHRQRQATCATRAISATCWQRKKSCPDKIKKKWLWY